MQQRCHFLAARLFVVLLLGHHKPAFEISKPGRHHQIVGGDLDPLLADGFDERQILLGQCQNRNPRQIDLLPARKIEQKVERTFIAAHVNVQHGGFGTFRRFVEPGI